MNIHHREEWRAQKPLMLCDFAADETAQVIAVSGFCFTVRVESFHVREARACPATHPKRFIIVMAQRQPSADSSPPAIARRHNTHEY